MTRLIESIVVVALAAGVAGATAPPTLTRNVVALTDDTTANPPDAAGAVGPNHVVAIANTSIVIHDKSGSVLAGPTAIGTFFSSLGFSHASYRDPRVQYVPSSDRFVVAAAADPATATSSVVIAISKTGDPTGQYWMYDLRTDAGGAVSAGFVQLGFNATWIVVTADLFDVSGGAFAGSRVWACDRAAVSAGSPTTCTKLDRNAGQANGAMVPALTYDAVLGTEYILDAGDPAQSNVRVLALAGPVGAETLTQLGAVTLATGAWAASATPSNNGFAPQSGTTTNIETFDARVRSAIMRNGKLWGAQTIYVPAIAPTRTAVQWFELDPVALTAVQAGRIDDSTGTFYYAYPSIAVNASDDLFVGYARFSSGTFASAGYTMRFHDEPAGTLRDPAVLAAGIGPYVKLLGGPLNQWGRYGTTAVDPSNLGFWTLQQAAAAPQGGCVGDCGRWKLQWGEVAITCALETCIAEDECHIAGTCDNVAGCSNPNAPDGTACSLGSCASGVCTPPLDGADDAGVPSDAGNGATGSGGGCCDAGDGDAPISSFVLALVCALSVQRRKRMQ